MESFTGGGLTMNDRDLLILKYLHTFNNITKTANALFISQPALTARIKQLEQELGTKLIYSSNKGIYLTATGLEAAAFADEELQRLDDFKLRIQAMEDETVGSLKLAAPNIIAQYYLPSVIKKFKETHPKVKFDVTVAQSSDVASLLNSKKCLFGFLRNDFGWGENERLLLCVNYITAVSLQPFRLKDLEHMDRVNYRTDTYYIKMLDLWWNDTFSTPPQTDVMVSSLDLCKEMVFSGLGFGLLPSIFLPECPEAYSYILKDKDGRPIERKTWFIYKTDTLNYKPARDFFKFIKENDFNQFLQLRIPRTRNQGGDT